MIHQYTVPRPKSLPPCGGKVWRREPRRMRGPPPPVPVTEHARDRRGQAPPLRRGPKSPAGFQPPQKPSPHRGEGVAARAAADEGSSFLRPTHRICQRRGRKARPCGETENAPAPSSLPQVAPPRTTLRRLMIIYKEGPSFWGRRPPSKALCNKADAMLPFCYILLRPLDDFELLRYHTHTGKGSCTGIVGRNVPEKAQFVRKQRLLSI